MKNFTNPVILQEFKGHYTKIILGILLIVLGIVFWILGDKVNEEAYQKMPSMHNVIAKEENKDGILTYIDSTNYPYLFAGYNDTDAKYYFIQDDNYIYVAYMDLETYNRLSDENLYTNGKTEKLVGISTLTPTDVKKIAIDTYNEIFPDNQITIADYDNYFGSVYLDMTSSDTDSAVFQYFIAIIGFMIGVICLFIGIISKSRFQKNLKKMSLDQIRTIDTETLDTNSFYYDKLHLYLTPSYIVLMNKNFKVIAYDDIIWLYPFEQRVNGIKSSKSIMVVTQDGKTTNIATVPVITKSRVEMFEEIFNTIANKNSEMLVGYSSENAKLIKEQIKLNKEIK